ACTSGCFLGHCFIFFHGRAWRRRNTVLPRVAVPIITQSHQPPSRKPRRSEMELVYLMSKAARIGFHPLALRRSRRRKNTMLFRCQQRTNADASALCAAHRKL
ncbi:hypothetical protein F442_00211, partial [Phytophthora nicotianae P10297]